MMPRILLNRFIIVVALLGLGTSSVFSQEKRKLPPPVNTSKFIEFAPSVSADGKTLIFESDRQGDWKLFESKRNGNLWSVPVAIPKISNTFFEKAPLGGPCLSYDGNYLFFSASNKDSEGKEDIYFSVREKNGWSAPRSIGAPINSADYEGYPSVSPDGKKLYFARGKLLGEMKKDLQQMCYKIMVSEKGSNGNWGTPVELPAPVNIECEKAPRIMPDGKTLIFSSIRKEGLGDFDLYKTELQANGSWSNPENLKFANTRGLDQYASVPACGDVMYFVQDGDIYTSAVPFNVTLVVQGWVTDSTTGKSLSAKIKIYDADQPDRLSAEIESSGAEGQYTFVGKPNKKYIFDISEPGYHRKKRVVDLTILKSCEGLEIPLRLRPLAEKEPEAVDYHLAFEAVDAQTNLKIPAVFETSDTKTGQKTVFRNDAQTLQSSGTFRLKQKYAVNASLKGYKSESIALQVDEVKGLDPVRTIRLQPSSYNFKIRAYNSEIKNEALKDIKVKITDIASNQSFELEAPKGGLLVETNLQNDRQYKVEISADLMLSNEQIIRKTPNLEMFQLLLAPKQGAVFLFTAIDAKTSEVIGASFKVTSSKTGKEFKGTTTATNSQFGVSLYKSDSLKVELNAKGYQPTIQTFGVGNFSLGERREYSVKMIPEKFSLTILVLEEGSQKVIKSALVKLKDLSDESQIPVTNRAEADGFIANIKRKGQYELALESPEYASKTQKIDQIPENGILKVYLSRQKNLSVTFNVIDAQTGKPVKADMHIKLEKSNKIFTAEKVSDYEVKITALEVFTIETSSTGYKSKISTYNMSDFNPNKKYDYEVRLEKAPFVLEIKAINILTKAPLKEAQYKITDLSTNQSLKALPEMKEGIASVGLNQDVKYSLEITADGFEPFQENLSKLSQNQMTFGLKPKTGESAVILELKDAVSGKKLAGTFKLTHQKSQKTINSKTNEGTMDVKVPLTQIENYKIEVSVKGYPVKVENFDYPQLGKIVSKLIVLVKEASVLGLKAVDEATKKPVKDVVYSVLEMPNSILAGSSVKVPAGITGFNVKPGKEYLIKAKAQGFIDYEEKYLVGSEDTVKTILLKTIQKSALSFYVIDAQIQNRIPALVSVIAPSGETIAKGNTDALKTDLKTVLQHGMSYTIRASSKGYKSFEGKIKADSSTTGKEAVSVIALSRETEPFTFRVLDNQTKKAVLNSNVKISDLKSGQLIAFSQNGESYAAQLVASANYKIEVDAEGYASAVERIEPAKLTGKKDIFLEKKKAAIVAQTPVLSSATESPKVELPESKSSFDKIEKGKSIVLDNVYFLQGSFILQTESYPQLEKVTNMLKANPGVKIQISGHTDNVGDPRLNVALSENRAKVILNYLVSKGIDDSRLFYKGYGGANPVAPNDTEDNKKKNRRVEITGIE
ncbi:OmpA family protein [Pseudarcicella hirudinis]|uniref:OmpA family protein n=1 Tax=Pseudarcicella hirudinis TaxID=1079859 RepID=UPI000B8A0D67|nr:OmpA family protein [Pseudarcicella hirudinis]